MAEAKPALSFPDVLTMWARAFAGDPAARAVLVSERSLEHCTEIKIKTWQKRRLERTGPPYHKIGAAVRYRLGDVIDWMGAATT